MSGTVTVFTTRPDTLYGATFFVVAADAPLAAELCAPEQRAELDAYRRAGRKLSDIDRQSTDRPKTGVNLGVVADQPGQRRASCRSTRPTTCWPTTAPARSWRCPRTTSATWTSPAPSTCRCGSSSTPASRTRTRPASPTAGDGVLVNSGPLDGLAQGRGDRRGHRPLEERGHGQRRGQLPAARLAAARASASGAARSRSSTARACGERRRCPTTSCRCGCPT